MAETKPTATASVKATSVQTKKSSNAISWLAPIICLIAGYLIWRFILGDADGFNQPDKSGGLWPKSTAFIWLTKSTWISKNKTPDKITGN